jgi:4-hydroxy 2-oxovalerate aldolase
MYKVLDCTVRDGGYVNDWKFTDDFVRDLYKANVASGVDIMEVGFRRCPDNSGFGKWYYTTEELINNTLQDIYNDKCKLALMCQIDTFELSDFVPRKDSLIGVVRVLWAYHSLNKDDTILNIDDFPKIHKMLTGLYELGYDVCFNIGRVDKMSYEQLDTLVKFINTTPIKYFYIADTYGHLDINLTKNYLTFLKQKLDNNIELGFHAHNNLNNSTTKTLLSLEYGVSIVDGTIFGYGRGSGNAYLELLLANKVQTRIDDSINIVPILDFIDKYIKNYKDQNYLGYGYNIIYLLSGLYSMHVNYAVEIIETNKKVTVEEVWKVFNKIISENKHNYYNSSLINKYL